VWRNCWGRDIWIKQIMIYVARTWITHSRSIQLPWWMRHEVFPDISIYLYQNLQRHSMEFEIKSTSSCREVFLQFNINKREIWWIKSDYSSCDSKLCFSLVAVHKLKWRMSFCRRFLYANTSYLPYHYALEMSESSFIFRVYFWEYSTGIFSDRWKELFLQLGRTCWVDSPLSVGLTHYSGRVTQICVFNTVKLGTSASSP